MLVESASKRGGFTDLQVAMNGRSLLVLQRDYAAVLHVLIRHCRVFARMKPVDKQYIVQDLINNKASLYSFKLHSGDILTVPEKHQHSSFVQLEAGTRGNNLNDKLLLDSVHNPINSTTHTNQQDSSSATNQLTNAVDATPQNLEKVNYCIID